MKKALVIGYGSIGRRHERVLLAMGFEVDVVSRHKEKTASTYRTMKVAVASNVYDYIVIANETSMHFETLKMLCELEIKNTVLVEKPLFSELECSLDLTMPVYVAYNLRFHPILREVITMLNNEQVLSANVYAGQYLPSWRPQSNYTESYSAKKHLGGGVLRDLSHEIDYLTYLFGDWKALVAHTGKISRLNIDSEDYCTIQVITANKVPIQLELNYLDRITQRYMTIQTNSRTIKVDFINSMINVNGNVFNIETRDRDYTYRKQHEAILSSSPIACTYEQGYRVVEMIEAVERSSILKEWMYNE